MKRGSRSLLIVDDNEYDRSMFERAFRTLGLTGAIHFATDGDEAIAYLKGTAKYANRADYPYPDCLITDLNMPMADGFAVLEYLKTNPERAIIPCIVFSDSNDPEDVRTAYKLGASAYHLKPSNFEDLCSQLKLLNEYWVSCLVPEVDSTGKQLTTEAHGRIGERFKQPFQRSQNTASQRAPL